MPSIGLAMIVKNGAKSLRRCIASVEGVVDQVVIADTGSTDGTPQLARELGAKVFDFPWQDSFADARNAAIQTLTTDWALIMDDDEELDPQVRAKIAGLLNNSRVGGYSATQRNYLPVRFCEGGHAPSAQPINSAIPHAEGARSYADFTSYRLVRRHPQIRYTGRVHELVDPSIRALGLGLASADFVIHHFGHLCSPDEVQEKDLLYRRLSQAKTKDAPNDAHAWIELGLLEYERFRNYSAAIECFRKGLGLNPNGDNVPYLSLANLYIEIHADERALELLSRVAMKGRQAGEKEHICGDALYNLGRLKEARRAYLRALGHLRDNVRIICKLGLTEVRLGLRKTGLARLAAALKVAPDVVEMHDRMIKAYIVMNMIPEAAAAAERLAAGLPNPSTILRAAAIRGQMREWGAASDIVIQGLQLFPHNQELLQACAELEIKATVLQTGSISSIDAGTDQHSAL
jgi:glycosyltransferase involved in cell wall biosynthesis